MITVQNGYRLQTYSPASRDYRYTETASGVIRTPTAPFDPANQPPYMVTDQGGAVKVVDYYDRTTWPARSECTAGSFSFTTTAAPQTVWTLDSGWWSGAYYPQMDGWIYHSSDRYSDVPLQYCVFHTQQNSCAVRSDGSIYYTIDAPFVAVRGIADGDEWYVYDNSVIFRNVNGMIIAPQNLTQQEYLYTVSGGAV